MPLHSSCSLPRNYAHHSPPCSIPCAHLHLWHPSVLHCLAVSRVDSFPNIPSSSPTLEGFAPIPLHEAAAPSSFSTVQTHGSPGRMQPLFLAPPNSHKGAAMLRILLPIPQHFPPGNPICGPRNWFYSFPNTTLPPGTRKPHLRRSCFSGSRFCEREACSSKSRSAASEAGEEIKIWAVLASPQTSGCNRHCLGPRLHSPPAWPPACAMERGGEGGEDGDGSIRAPSELWGWARSACGVQLPPDTLLQAALHPPNPS